MYDHKMASEDGRTNHAWECPLIRPISRLGEMTTPTTFSASTPERHSSDITEMSRTFKKPTS